MTINNNKLAEMAPFQKTYLWSVSGIGSSDVEMLAETSGIPEISGSNTEVQLRGSWTRELGVYKPQNISMTFLETERGQAGKPLHKWLNEHYDPDTGCGDKSKAQKEIILTLEGCSTSGAGSYTLHRALLESLGGEQLSSDASGVFKYNVSISCDYVTFK